MSEESEFVQMKKGEWYIFVHPLVVADHQALGWVVVEQPVVEKPAAPVVEKRKPAPRKGLEH